MTAKTNAKTRERTPMARIPRELEWGRLCSLCEATAKTYDETAPWDEQQEAMNVAMWQGTCLDTRATNEERA